LSDVTRILHAIEDGDTGAAEALLPLVYDQLRRIAQQKMAKERPEHSLQATALVHEVYLRLVGEEDVKWVNRAHFFAAAAEAMRRILVESARSRGRIKRGGERKRVPLNVVDLAAENDPAEILALSDALDRLEKQDPRMAKLVMLRFFSGLSVEETASAMEMSPRTVKREWAMARAWLFRELSETDA
jgi:RNA polymerase sigma factor (TIGR02999 family)